jgi:hypothetical protein
MPNITQAKPDERPAFEPPRNSPSAVRRWHDILVSEGVKPRLAFYRALDRAADEGEISDAGVERLAQHLRDHDGRLDLG